jgi:hypothetical protein
MAERSLDDLINGLAHENGQTAADFSGELTPADQLNLAKYLRTLTYQGEPAAAGAEPNPAEPPPPGAGDAAPETALQAGSTLGAVNGSITNASGGEVPAGLTVTLYGFDEFQQVLTATTTVDSTRAYAFAQVDMPAGRAFISVVEHQGGTYTSDIAQAAGDGGELILPVQIYDSSTDTAPLTIDRLHIFFEFLAPDMVRVAELILVTNPTDRMIVAAVEGEPVISFNLPAGAVNLQFQEGAVGTQFALMPGGFGDLRGIAPGVGQHQILFSFDLPYARSFELNQSVDLPVEALVVLLPQVGVEVDSGFLVSGGLRDVDGRTYELFTGGRVEAGSVLPVALKGTPDTGGGVALSSGSGASLTVGLVALGGVFMFLGLWLFQRRRAHAVAEDPEPEAEPLPRHIARMNSDELMDAIIALDDRYKAGDLPDSAYRKQRGVLKERLKSILEGDGG